MPSSAPTWMKLLCAFSCTATGNFAISSGELNSPERW